MNRDPGDANCIGHALFVICQPAACFSERITSLRWCLDSAGCFAPRALTFALEESFDGAVHGFPPLEHDQMTGRADIHIFTTGNCFRYLFVASTLKDNIAVTADHHGWN